MRKSRLYLQKYIQNVYFSPPLYHKHPGPGTYPLCLIGTTMAASSLASSSTSPPAGFVKATLDCITPLLEPRVSSEAGNGLPHIRYTVYYLSGFISLILLFTQLRLCCSSNSLSSPSLQSFRTCHFPCLNYFPPGLLNSLFFLSLEFSLRYSLLNEAFRDCSI